jgi:hypothetical protein
VASSGGSSRIAALRCRRSYFPKTVRPHLAATALITGLATAIGTVSTNYRAAPLLPSGVHKIVRHRGTAEFSSFLTGMFLVQSACAFFRGSLSARHGL